MLTRWAKQGLERTHARHTFRQFAMPCLWLANQSSNKQLGTSFMYFSATCGLMKKSSKRKQKSDPVHIESTKNIEPKAHTFREEVSHPENEMSEEQQTILDLVLNQRKSVFFTGPAGTGKSVLLGKIVKGLQETYFDRDSVAVTASTGLAAYNISGKTLHRFAGIGLGKAPTEKLIGDILEDEPRYERWMKVKVLIIDEISMIDSTLFNKLDKIAREVRGVNLPFGGIQLVITGDFFQLPPVLQGKDDGSQRFCFEAKAWKSAIKNMINLTTIYRQKDPVFSTMLNQIRKGVVSRDTINTFKKLDRPLEASTLGITGSTELFPLRREADQANEERLHRLPGGVKRYKAYDEDGIIKDPNARKRLLNDCIAPEVLKFKKGAQVMLIKNIGETLVNGSQGTIVGFANSHTFLRHRWDDEDDKVYPKSVTSCSLGDDSETTMPLYPVVRFYLKNGGTRIELCKPAEWAVERWVPDPDIDGCWIAEKLASRVQVPLILAWALSIHKAQGQTLERVKVDLNRVFEMGQAYVALSRATTMNGLQVMNFDPSKVTVHPKVKRFYTKLEKIT